ncbi:MAG TPA: VOC family protein [Gemmatimonadaceae bacterium]|nr:VOC family protein [Gemmatimonadaceae bacterium]
MFSATPTAESTMGSALPPVPRGSGHHPILMVTIAANDLAASTAFYRQVFGWPCMTVAPDIASTALPSGPVVTLRAKTPEGFQGAVPFIAVADVPAALQQVVAAGGAVEREPWAMPMAGTLARFTDPAGTVYGLASAPGGAPLPHIPAPFGDAPKPPNGTICSLEMHAGDLDVAARFFGDQFGWATLPTMPQFLMFDAGAGIGGVFQSHTPASRGVAYVYATDVRATIEAVEAAGGKRMGDPMAMPGMATFGYFSDPSGTMMGLIGG